MGIINAETIAIADAAAVAGRRSGLATSMMPVSMSLNGLLVMSMRLSREIAAAIRAPTLSTCMHENAPL